MIDKHEFDGAFSIEPDLTDTELEKSLVQSKRIAEKKRAQTRAALKGVGVVVGALVVAMTIQINGGLLSPASKLTTPTTEVNKSLSNRSGKPDVNGKSGGEPSEAGSSTSEISGKKNSTASTVTTTMNHNPATTSPTSSPSRNGSSTSTTTSVSNSTQWPGPTNTGVPAGTKLTAHSGDLVITTDGTLVDGLDISGQVDIRANNVTIKNSRIRCGSCTPVVIVRTGFTNILVSDVEIDGLNSQSLGIGYSNLHIVRANIHGLYEAFRLADNNLVEDSWVHDLYSTGSSYAMQTTGGTGDILRHNNFSMPKFGNSVIVLKSDLSAVDNWTFDHNLIDGANYTVFIGHGGGSGVPTNVTFINNHFGRNFVSGITDIEDSALPNISQSGNVWDDNGQPFTLS